MSEQVRRVRINFRGLEVATSVIALAAAVWFLTYASELLIPLAIAVLIWTLINALSGAISRLGVGRLRPPQWLSMIVALLLVSGGLALVGDIISDSAQQIVDEAPAYEATLNKYLADIAEFSGIDLGADLRGLISQLSLSEMVTGAAAGLSSLVGNTAIILIYLLFLFLEQGVFPMKLAALVKEETRQGEMRAILHQISSLIQRYIRVKTILSLFTAAISYAVLIWFEVKFAGFWALLIFILNYIPTVGSTLGAVLPSLQVLVQFGDPAKFGLVLAILGLFPQFTIGNIIEPRFMGRSLNLSPFVIILSLAVWGFMWGVAGLFLAVPLTVILMIICSHFGPTRWLAILLSRDGQIAEPPSPDVR
ncbi:MAG: AI-2E family transporter [Alphaproteobacteria bacterium]